MEPASAGPRAGILRPIISPPGKPDALAWAKLTTDLIVQAAPQAPMERRMMIAALRRQIAWALFDIFRGLHSTDLPITAANQMWERICSIGQTTEWGFLFAADPVQASIKDLLLRNARSYIDILGN